jgi:hypothetical protein
MSRRRAQVGPFFALALALGVLLIAPRAASQSFVRETVREETSFANSRTIDGLTGDEIVARMTERNRLRSEHLQSYSAVRKYEIRNPGGRVSAVAVVRMDYQAPGRKKFQKVSEEGSWVVRHLVFDRLLQSEEETSSGQERSDSAISDKNYRFAIVGEENLGPRRCFIVEAKPKRTDKYLFEGELWIDAEDFGIARISGHPAAKLSFWINRVEFVRQFQRIDGYWLPQLDETIVDIKTQGRREFRIEHQQYVIHTADNSRPQQQE